MSTDTLESLRAQLAVMTRERDAMKMARDDHFRNAQRLASLCTKITAEKEQALEITEMRHEQQLKYIALRVEMALFDSKHCTPEEAIAVIALSPAMPWNKGPWKVARHAYAEAFYKKFPKAVVHPLKSQDHEHRNARIDTSVDTSILDISDNAMESSKPDS